MKTRTMIYVGGIGATGTAAAYGNGTMAAVFAVGMILVLCAHHIEVKLNKLLDHYGIRVSDRDLAD